MSHRNSEGHIAPQSRAQDLVRVFEWLLAGVDLSGVGFRRDSHCSPRALVVLALLWVQARQIVRIVTTHRRPVHHSECKCEPGERD